MRELVMRYLNNGLSRRGFLKQMAAAGFSTVAATSVLESLSPFTAEGATLSAEGANGVKTMTGTGGEVLVEQWCAAGAEFCVVGNSSHSRGVYDALVDHPRMHLILSVEEGQGVAIASGYAMASGKLGVAMMSVAGAPHASSNMFNARMARLPM